MNMNKSGLKNAIIIDVDGTLALMEGNRKPFDYHRSFGDTPNVPVFNLVRDLYMANKGKNNQYNIEVFIFSGRENKLLLGKQRHYYVGSIARESNDILGMTDIWLKYYFNMVGLNFGVFPYEDFHLHLRKYNDHRPDDIVKLEMYNNIIKDKYNVLYVIDDRNKVVDMWRNTLKLPVLQVADGDF